MESERREIKIVLSPDYLPLFQSVYKIETPCGLRYRYNDVTRNITLKEPVTRPVIYIFEVAYLNFPKPNSIFFIQDKGVFHSPVNGCLHFL